MSNLIFFIYFMFILNLISIIICQFEKESMTKAIACMAVLNQKLKGKEPQSNIYSSMMLKCFATITNSQSKKILEDIEKGGTISQKEIKKLTDYNSLNNMSPKELERKSNDLEKAITKIQKLQEDFNKEGGGDIDPADYDDYYDDDDNFNTETPKNIHFFGLIPKGIYGIFNVFNNYLSLFIVFLIVYFVLLMFRKINDSDKKNKKKKKIQEEYEEAEDEDEPEINEQLEDKNNKNENQNLNKKEKNG